MKNNHLYIIFGTICVSFLVYHRLIKARLPQVLIPLPPEKLFFLMSMLLSTTMLLFASIYILYRKFYPKIKDTFMTILLQKITTSAYNPVNIIYKSMAELDYYIKDKLPTYDHNLSYSMFLAREAGLSFLKHFQMALILIFFVRIMPQIVITIVFLYEVFITHNLNYFYKTLTILLFPLLVRYIMYSIKIFIDNNLENLNELIDMYIIDKTLYNPEDSFANAVKIDIFIWHQLLSSHASQQYISVEVLTTNPKYNLPEDTQSRRDILLVCRTEKNDFLDISDALESYSKYKVIIDSITNILRYSLYLYAWSYILLSNFPL